MRGAARDGRQTPIFLHLPKTGGRTLETVLRRQYGADGVFGVYAPTPDDALARYRRLTEEQKRAYRAISGHLPVDLHEEVPGPCVYVTLLRHPVRRVVSGYYYARSNPKHPKHEAIVENDMSLSEVLRSGLVPMFESGQARVLGDWWGEYGTCPPETADRAMENIERHVAVAGLTERYDESLLLMGRQLGWRWTRMLYVRKNVTSGRPRVEDLPRETLELVREYNRVDLDLYRRVRERFETRVAKAGPQFRARVAAFRLANGAFAGQWRVRSRARRELRRLRRGSEQAR